MNRLEGYYKGINLGGWLSQCGNRYDEEHYNTFITEADIKKIAGWGLDHVRLPIDYNVVQTEDGKFIESGFKHIDDCILWCKKYGLKIVMDLHKACGYVFDNAEYCGFFYDDKLQKMFNDLWMEFTRRYGDEEIIAFELLNEVTEARFADVWNEISAKTIKMIHKEAPQKTVIIGGIFNSSIYGLTKLPAPVDDNVVYTFHCYDPMIFTHQDAGWVPQFPKGYRTKYRIPVKELRKQSMDVFGSDYDGNFAGLNQESVMSADFFRAAFQTAVDVGKKYNVPLYCGEYGVIDDADRESAFEWYKDIHEVLEENKYPRAAWSYKEMNFDTQAEINKEIIKYL